MLHRTRVLLIDDDAKGLELLSLRLTRDGFDVQTALSGAEGLQCAYEMHPDVILLDQLMPGLDGLEVCRRLRDQTDAVVILLTVKGSPEDVVRGLQAGADDYLVKPYNYAELQARIDARLRRRSKPEDLPPIRLAQGEAVLIADPARQLVFIENGRSVQLTPKEFELLRFLVCNRGRVLSAEAILANAWGPGYEGEQDLVKQFIHQLRAKLEADPASPEHIVTIRGSGYAFEEEIRPVARRRQNEARSIA